MTATVKLIDLPAHEETEDHSTAVDLDDVSPNGSNIDVVWHGSSTVLFDTGRFRILADLGFFRRIRHAPGRDSLRVTRRVSPAPWPATTPVADLMVLSHHEVDTLEADGAFRLPRDIPVMTTRRSARPLRDHGFSDVTPVDMWQRIILRRGDDEIHIMTVPPPRSGRSLFSPKPGPASLVELRQNGGVQRFIVGGSAQSGQDLHSAPDRFPGVDAVLMRLPNSTDIGIALDSASGRDRPPSDFGSASVVPRAVGADSTDLLSHEGKSDQPSEKTRGTDPVKKMVLHRLKPGEHFVFDASSPARGGDSPTERA